VAQETEASLKWHHLRKKKTCYKEDLHYADFKKKNIEENEGKEGRHLIAMPCWLWRRHFSPLNKRLKNIILEKKKGDKKIEEMFSSHARTAISFDIRERTLNYRPPFQQKAE